ncbi:hypothetical protein KM043_016216 [Ampulex compressa]|nr:hypothetical protein KM043_016216 [Ampulex compressa]
MAFSACIFLLSILAISNGATPNDIQSQIISGEDVDSGEFPYQVSLQYKTSKRHFCSGSILNKDYVLTTARCLYGKKASDIIVVAATLDLEHPRVVHDVEKLNIHESYQSGLIPPKFDIAIIKVQAPFSKSNGLSFAPLPDPCILILANDDAVLSGWGRAFVGGAMTKILQRISITMSGQNYCEQVYSALGIRIADSMICAHDPNGRKGPCDGDQGGPLTINGYVVGLVSASLGCADPQYPAIYTRVSSFLDWIEKHTR